MTELSSPKAPEAPPKPKTDDGRAEMTYGHGRMPLFMKIVWVAFLVFAIWYTVTFLLDALGSDLAR